MVLSVEGDIKESKCSGFAVSCMIHIAILKSMDTMQAELPVMVVWDFSALLFWVLISFCCHECALHRVVLSTTVYTVLQR